MNTSTSSSKLWLKYLSACFLILVAYVSCAGGKGNPGDEYAWLTAGAWREDLSVDLARILVKNSIPGCGQNRWKARPGGQGEYAVQCTRDGNVWKTYLLYSYSQKVVGPISIAEFQKN